MRTRTADVAVVGGGVAGLVAARALAIAGLRVAVLDGAGAGGAVARRRLDGLDIDVGAEGFATRGGVVLGLLAELGLADRVVRPEPIGTWIYRPDDASRIPDGAVLGIPTDLDDPALAQLGHEAARRVQRDAKLAGTVGADAATLGALVRTRMGDAVADTWAAPLVAGVHRLDIDEIAPELLLPGVLARLAEQGSLAAALGGGGGELAGLAGGVAQLADALIADLTRRGGTVEPEAVRAVERDGGDWRLRTASGDIARTPRLLLACAPWSWPAGLPEDVAAAARRWPPPRSVDLVTLVMADDGGGQPAGVVVAEGGGRVHARALTYSSAKWAWLREAAGERAVIRLTYDARDLDDAALVERAIHDAAELTGAAWSPTDLRAFDRTRWEMPRSAVEPEMAQHRTTMRAALESAPALDATGGWLDGTGLAWVVGAALATAERSPA